jgi:exodeoxyribonuclease VII large subunit
MSATPIPNDRRRIYRVAELTRLIKTVLENEVGSVWIEGEVSNARKAPSGHVYFTLKDESAQIAAVFFRGSQLAARVEIKDGARIRVQGDVTVYEQRGQYQVIVRRVEEAGQGDLQAAFEQLKARLAAEGLFDPPARSRCRCCPATSAWSPRPPAPPSATC